MGNRVKKTAGILGVVVVFGVILAVCFPWLIIFNGNSSYTSINREQVTALEELYGFSFPETMTFQSAYIAEGRDFSFHLITVCEHDVFWEHAQAQNVVLTATNNSVITTYPKVEYDRASQWEIKDAKVTVAFSVADGVQYVEWFSTVAADPGDYAAFKETA